MTTPPLDVRLADALQFTQHVRDPHHWQHLTHIEDTHLRPALEAHYDPATARQILIDLSNTITALTTDAQALGEDAAAAALRTLLGTTP